jgi:hypothetical protein
MAKTRKPRTGAKRARRARGFEAIPLDRITPAEERLARKFDTLVTSAKVTDRQIKAMQTAIIGAKIRGGSFSAAGKDFIDFRGAPPFTWPNALYVPRNQQASSRPKPPDSRLYSHNWTAGDGVATASRDTGALYAYAAAGTADRFRWSDAAVGITYSPSSSLSYVTYQPDVYCSIGYRMFVDFWPNLIAGQVQLGLSVITGAWLQSPGSYQLQALNKVVVFDSFPTDAPSTVFPDIRHTLQRSFVNSALATTFLVKGGQTYVFGVVARAWVAHNVTTSTGSLIPQDPKKFKLYADMLCTVPYMAVTVKQVLIP